MPGTPSITVITVTFNGMRFMEAFFQSLMETDQQGLKLDVLLIDNGSTDGTVDWVRLNYPQVRVFENDENNYTRALNLGIANSFGDYVAITNNDAIVHRGWLQGFLPTFQSDERVGAVQSKLCFSETNRINSVGVKEVGHFYFADIGFDMDDSARYAKPREREYITGGSVMFRRACLEDVGEWDEDFIMFMEDVDYSARCRKRGWKLWFSPSSIIYHQYHGSLSQQFCDYFCTRNRFFFVAKHFPLELAESIPTSHFYQRGETDNVYRSLLHSVQKMCTCHDTETVKRVLQDLENCLPRLIGDVAAYRFFSHLEVLLGLRRIRVGILDNSEQFAEESQRYIAEIAAIMQEDYDVEFVSSREIDLVKYREWFELDLSKCSTKIVKPSVLEPKSQGADLDILSLETLHYDIFVNANMPAEISMEVMGDRVQRRDMAEQIHLKNRLSDHSVFQENLEKLLADAELQLFGQEILPISRATAAAV